MEEVPTAVIAIRKLNKTTGAARIALQQISILKSMGYRVKVICEKANKKTVASYGADLKIIPKLPLSSFIRRLWFSKRANAWCRQHRPSLVISHGDMENSDIIYMHNCIDLAQEIMCPHVVGNQSDVSKIHHRVLQKSKYKLVVANSQMMANDLIKRYKIPSEKVSISYPGFDDRQFNTSVKTSSRMKQREELGIKDKEKLIGLITSGDFKKRNLDLFVDIAYELIHNSEITYRFLVIGQGDITPYKEKATKLGIEKHFTWKKTVPNVECYYVALDVFVLPAHIEEFGCVVLEAMACSTIPLISERVGAGELLQNELKDLIIKGYDSKEWFQAIDNINHSNNSKITEKLVNTAKKYSYDYQYNVLQGLISQHLQNSSKDEACFTQLKE
ncbi:glycosyltransferase family 4 protein [Vreelandella neptunia]|uniref:glycosyltransferase family 4 protein n=1 Tax=Vreelandella neptunia TaxID=115551 RepID=UPI00315A16E2